MKKLSVFFLILLLTPLIGGLYGILHDQLTYSISSEYYTKFKFIQFGFAGIEEAETLSPARLYVALTGFLATWWMGIPIGLILGLTGLIHKDHMKMFRAVMKGISVTLLLSFATGLIGLLFGWLVMSNDSVTDWWLPENLIEHDAFVAVGSMHSFSYPGGVVGLVGGIVKIVREKKRGE